MEIFKLLGIIAIENDSANKAIDDTTSKADGAQGKLSTAFSKIGTFAVNAGKVVATGLAAGASAIGALTKTAVEQYSEYEQLVGGVETLFGDSANTIKWYASQAYESAGMSANEYMSTVTSFSASLLQGLDGDTAKAAEVANRAITDMSDNANKMGTDISMIQNAYQGFAKQNYTMLDNLKLGYGGTQSEMARLINESGVLGDTITVTAETVNQVSFDKIIEAIGVVQDEMGITGTTANEASTTIQGSVSSMKAAWTNLLTAIAYGDGGINYFLENFVATVKTALEDNLIPRIVQVLGGLSLALEQLMPVIAAQLPAILEQLLPGVISGATALLSGLIVALPTILQVLIDQLPSIFSQLGTAIKDSFPVLLETCKELFGQIWDYIAVELLGTEADFESTLTNIKEQFSEIMDALGYAWETVGQPCFDALSSAFTLAKDAVLPLIEQFGEYVSSGELVEDITDGIKSACDWLVGAYEDVVDAAVAVSDWCTEHQTTLENIAIVVGSIATAFGLMKASMVLTNAITEAWMVISGAATTTTTAFGTAIAFLTSPIGVLTAAIAGIIAICALLIKNWDEIKAWAINLWESIKETFTGIKDSVVEKVTELKEKASEIFNGIKSVISDTISAAKDTVSEKLNNMKSAFEEHGGGIKGIAAAAVEGVKGYYSAGFTFIDNLTGGKLSDIATKFTDKMDAVKSTVSEKLEAVKTKFTDIFESAKTTVSNAIEKIKGFFKFDWSLPDLKLPHFGVTGNFSLNPLSFPRFSVEWYDKAMDNAMLLNDATIFGASGGKLLGGGESGAEVVSGADTLMNMIGSVVESKMAAQNAKIISLLSAILNTNEEMVRALLSKQVLELDEREVGRVVRSYA